MKHLLQIAFDSKRRAGNIMLEFAIGSSLLVAAFAGTFQFGYTFYAYNKLATAVNDGARYAALRPYNSTTTTPKADFLLAVQNPDIRTTAGAVQEAARSAEYFWEPSRIFWTFFSTIATDADIVERVRNACSRRNSCSSCW